jgi:dephospho-CoA kinase
MEISKITIGLVGPCASGKTTLKNGLIPYGLVVKHIAQEHSYVQNMWKRLSNPDFLIYLDVSYEISKIRKSLNWTYEEYHNQTERLTHARNHADLYIHTDELSIDQVLEVVLNFLQEKGYKYG